MRSRSSSTLSLALAMLLVGAAGCGKSNSTGKAAGDPRSAAIIATSKELRDRACACTEPMCAATVRRDHDVWLRGQLDEMAKLGEPKSTADEQKQANDLQHALFACLATYGADKTAPAPMPRSVTDPAAAPPAPPATP